MTVINLSDYRGGAANGSLRAVAFWIAANGAEHLIRFDLFADRAQLIAWLTPLAPPDHMLAALISVSISSSSSSKSTRANGPLLQSTANGREIACLCLLYAYSSSKAG